MLNKDTKKKMCPKCCEKEMLKHWQKKLRYKVIIDD